MSKKILVAVQNEFEKLRKISYIKNIEYWTSKRSLELEILDIQTLEKNINNLAEYSFVYLPHTLYDATVVKFLKKNTDLPIVVDRATPVKGNKNIFENHRLAIRNAFGSNTQLWEPEQQVPMMPHPYNPVLGDCERDVIVFDVKQFHDYHTHLYIASLLLNTLTALPKIEESIGKKLNIYFTSFFDYSVYFEFYKVLEKFNDFKKPKDNLMKLLESRLIKTLDNHEEYLQLLERTRLLITEHGDIADVDLLHSLCLGIPTLTYSRDTFARSNGFQSTILPAWCIIDNRFRSYLNFSNLYRVTEGVGANFALKINKVPKWDFQMYEESYLRSWDILLDWADNKNINEDLNKALIKGSWNRGVTFDKERQKNINSISCIL